MKFLLLIFISFPIFSAVKHDSVSSRLHDFGFEEFCKAMNAKSSMLTSLTNSNEVECFNQKFKIKDFCIKKLPLESNFTRGFGVESEKKIYCEEATSVSVTIDCDDHKNLCKNAENSCEKLKSIYAYNLEMGHASLTNKKLNCYFTKKINKEISEELDEELNEKI